LRSKPKKPSFLKPNSTALVHWSRAWESRLQYSASIGCSETRTVSARLVLIQRGCWHGLEFGSVRVPWTSVDGAESMTRCAVSVCIDTRRPRLQRSWRHRPRDVTARPLYCRTVPTTRSVTWRSVRSRRRRFLSNRVRLLCAFVAAGLGTITFRRKTLGRPGAGFLVLNIFTFIHQTGSSTNNDNSDRKLSCKHLIKNYSLLRNWRKPFTVEIYRNINGSCLLLRTKLGRSITHTAKPPNATRQKTFCRVGSDAVNA